MIDEIESIKSREIRKNGMETKSFVSNHDLSYKASNLTQLVWLIWRSFISSLRNPNETRIMVLQTIFIAIMFGLIFLRIELNQKGVQNINGVLFLLITNASFGNLFGVINTFPTEIPIFLREEKNRMYRVINYYLSKFIIEV
jgi:Na+/H+-dicarboxylate symporter